MATCNDIVRFAMQRLRLLSAGEQPTAEEGADGIVALQSLYDQWAQAGMFGRLTDVIASAAYTANEYERVQNSGNYAITLPTVITTSTIIPSYWPQYGVYGFSNDSAPRPPFDLAQIENVTSTGSLRYIWDTHAGAWLPLQGLLLTDQAPLAGRSLIGLASSLALLIADDFGATPGNATQRAATLFQFGLSTKYGSRRRPAMQDYY
jgi:hypothetical protein